MLKQCQTLTSKFYFFNNFSGTLNFSSLHYCDFLQKVKICKLFLAQERFNAKSAPYRLSFILGCPGKKREVSGTKNKPTFFLIVLWFPKLVRSNHTRGLKCIFWNMICLQLRRLFWGRWWWCSYWMMKVARVPDEFQAATVCLWLCKREHDKNYHQGQEKIRQCVRDLPRRQKILLYAGAFENIT